MSDKYVEGLSKRKFDALRGELSSSEQALVDRFYNGDTLDTAELQQLLDIARRHDAMVTRLSSEERRRRQELLDEEPDHYE